MSQPLTEKGGGRRVRLLVVDDIEPVRQVIAELLQNRGYEVELAANADEALKLAQLVRWDGVVLDVDLPGMNGVELYVQISRSNGTGCLPVIFYSGRPNEILRLGLGSTPWARFLNKPCGSRQFLVELEQCLRAGEQASSADANHPGA